jgi:hypothetical protein
MSERRSTYRTAGRSKYGAVKTECDGFKFDSKAEARRYGELKLMQQTGEISELVVHPKFRIDVEGQHICDYIGDFSYQPERSFEPVIEDVKGVRTAVYSIKRKLVKAIWHLDITEIDA